MEKSTRKGRKKIVKHRGKYGKKIQIERTNKRSERQGEKGT